MATEERYRLWLAGDTQWQPGPSFPHLALAIDKARRLAVTRWVAIELPTREWHVFDESKTTRLGPPQFARGSNLNLGERASEASAERPRTLEYPRPSTGNAGGGNTTYRVSGVRATRPVGIRQTSPISEGTHSGIGPERSPASSDVQPVQRAITQPGAGPVRRNRPTPSTSRSVNERRSSERFAAVEVLADPACYVEGQRVDISDVSETGLQLAMPPRIRLRIGQTIVLAFSDRHGRFDLVVKVVWARSGHAGVQIEDGGANLVGKMFLRKLIGQLVSRREANKRRGRRTSRPR